MTKLHVTQQEIGHAFRMHRKFYEITDGSRHPPGPPAMSRRLILCYAVECGLKHKLMRDRNLKDTKQVEEAVGLHHDLGRYIKEARLSADLALSAIQAMKTPPCRPSRHVQPSQLHEAFRYGVELAQEAHLVEQLKRVLKVCE
ncbi:MAG TPA: hypothetical protein PKE31_00965 [Pseudomonadota bacterium]|nr:hypothetical protein [Pseudomonadota bacterium]